MVNGFKNLRNNFDNKAPFKPRELIKHTKAIVVHGSYLDKFFNNHKKGYCHCNNCVFQLFIPFNATLEICKKTTHAVSQTRFFLADKQ